MIVGIDPGQQTGIAVFESGKLWKLDTIDPFEIVAYITAAKPARVIFEDSRLISHMFTTVKSRPAALKMARNVGEIDAWCKLIVARTKAQSWTRRSLRRRRVGQNKATSTTGTLQWWRGHIGRRRSNDRYK